jgi:hypothetical protein
VPPESPDRGAGTILPPLIPTIAAEADDVAVMRKVVEDTAAVSGGLWFSYLFVLFYLGIAAGAVTHSDLLLRNPVKLPFLSVELPLLAFFSLAPVLFVITHAYTLINLALLADRVRQSYGEICGQTGDLISDTRGSAIHTAMITRQLPSNIFVQFLGGSDEIRKGSFGAALATILWVTLVVAPISLLLLIQIQFLPYHSLWITWTSRIALVLDLGLIWWLWRIILAGRTTGPAARSGWSCWSLTKMTIAALLTMSTLVFACAIATIPGEWQENHLPGRSVLLAVRKVLFFGDVNETTRRRASFFSNTLILPGFNIYEALKIDDPAKIEWKERLVDLRGRDLNDSVLTFAVLARADLTGAHLQRQSLPSRNFKAPPSTRRSFRTRSSNRRSFKVRR